MFRRMFLYVSAVSIAVARLAGQTGCFVSPEVTDSYTALLDHFDGSTTGQVFGSVSYGSSVSGLHQALQFSSGSWVEYNLNGWFSWSSNYSPTNYGSIELWVKPASPRVAGSFLVINWYSSATPPSAGYITECGYSLDAGSHYRLWFSSPPTA
jgi:hypothetical protein